MPHPFTPVIVDALVHRLKTTVWDPLGEGDGDWTHTIMQTLAAVGGGYGYTPQCRRKHGGTGEYLLDHTWLKLGPNGTLVEVPLACESELDFSAQRVARRRKDFNKLLLARSAYRLFIFQEAIENGIQKRALDEIQTWLVQFKLAQPGDHFLLLVLDYRTEKRVMTTRGLEYDASGWTAGRDDQHYY